MNNDWIIWNGGQCPVPGNPYKVLKLLVMEEEE